MAYQFKTVAELFELYKVRQEIADRFIQKEKQVNINAFMELAKATQKDEFSADEIPGLTEEMKALLAEELDAEKKDKARAAVKEIISLLKKANSRKEAYVQAIRAAREQERINKARLADIDRAIAFANESGNYLPLVALVTDVAHTRHPINYGNDHLFNVPVDWNPSANGETKAVTPLRKKRVNTPRETAK